MTILNDFIILLTMSCVKNNNIIYVYLLFTLLNIFNQLNILRDIFYQKFPNQNITLNYVYNVIM